MKTRIIFMMLFLLNSMFMMSDPPAPPEGGSNGNSGTNGPPVGAPIDGGLGILMILGAGYGGIRLWKLRKDRSGEKDRSPIF